MKLTPNQQVIVDALADPSAFIAHGGSIFTGTRYRLNGEGRSFPARSLWSLVDRGVLAHTVERGRDIFRLRREA